MSLKDMLIMIGMVTAWVGVLLGLVYGLPRVWSILHRPTLVVAAWGDILDETIIRRFEQETGIHVQLSYYASNEELLVKLQKTGGRGYDIVIPSDYAVPELIKLRLLQPLDYRRLNFVDRVCPQLMGLWCDPHNTFVVPWAWEVYLFAIDTRTIPYSQARAQDWNLILRPTSSVVMVNDALEMALMAGRMLYGHTGPYTSDEIAHIVELLRAQRRHVVAYADARADYFLVSEQAQAIVAGSSYVLRAQKLQPSIAWILPSSGTFVSVEHIGIVAGSRSVDAAYQFINYIYKPESVREHYHHFTLLPATMDIVDDQHIGALRDVFIEGLSAFDTFDFFRPTVDRLLLNQMWLRVKL